MSNIIKLGIGAASALYSVGKGSIIKLGIGNVSYVFRASGTRLETKALKRPEHKANPQH